MRTQRQAAKRREKRLMARMMSETGCAAWEAAQAQAGRWIEVWRGYWPVIPGDAHGRRVIGGWEKLRSASFRKQLTRAIYDMAEGSKLKPEAASAPMLGLEAAIAAVLPPPRGAANSVASNKFADRM